MSTFAREPPVDVGMLAIELSESATSAADVAAIIGGLELLVAAAVFVELGVATRDHEVAFRAREIILASASKFDPSLGPVRAAMGDKSALSRAVRAVGQLPSLPPARFSPVETEWTQARNAAFGIWLRRTLINEWPEAYDYLFGWAQLEELQRSSPLRAKIGAGGGLVAVAAGGFAIAGPVGLAPAVFLGLAGAGVKLWHEVSEARSAQAKARQDEAAARVAEPMSEADLRIRQAEARAAEAKARSLESRARLDERQADIAATIEAAAGGNLANASAPRAIVELTIKTAEPALREIAASPDIISIEVDDSGQRRRGRG